MRIIPLLIFIISVSCVQTEKTNRKFTFQFDGIDVSHHQGEIDWSKVKNDSIDFVFIKATEGKDFLDTSYATNYREAKKSGLLVGSYHFFSTLSPGKNQALYFLEKMQIDKGDIIPVLDIEIKPKHDKKTLILEVNDFISVIEDSLGVTPIIYSNQNFFNKYLANFQDDLLWIARYNQKDPQLSGSAEWHFWQYGQRGKVSGINAFVDLNVFCCSKDDFYNRFVYKKRKLIKFASNKLKS